MRKSDLERNSLIKTLYFYNKLTLSEISTNVDLSVSQISRILSQFPNYYEEKANRKEQNRRKHNEQTKKIMKDKRNKKRLEDIAIMKKLHYQASIELSYFSQLSQVNIKKQCSSSYVYNKERKRYDFKNDIAYSGDMPKHIKY